ncbi:MAG: hypothetical protein K0S09_911 [Sphingobacteriaceae bacterium]|jgi:hypothetical protein|nr:hypothetical protein [Sphingobacteriaceae bacterium]
MKAPVIILLILFSLISSCKKEDIESSLVGTWELRTLEGDMGTITYPPGNGNVIKFTKGEYQILKNGAVTKAGTYTIVADAGFEMSICLVKKKGEFENRIIYDGDNSSQKTFIHISGNKLFLASGCFASDGGVKKEYEKQ